MAAEPDYDMLAARILRRMRPEIAQAFLDSPEWREIPEELRERIYVADARWEEIERRERLDTSPAGRDETPATTATQGDPEPGECQGCGAPIQRAGTGRRARYCSQACRQRAYRIRTTPTTATSPAHHLAEQVATSARRAADAITARTDAGPDLGRARAALAELAAMCDETS
ncbi:hypothetical protein IMZ11_39880 [Microtetraspora sp. AC03309]|uniref:hypothetical protein n=1 Tax=Microtetraspora sp. AC03309 TaxID=2779376 RepID=UPI001E5CDA3E|nr:hypothetical protein [Microtetraspora sp. AC03309]MCC5581778.1 hypothetical protein [Microtetraspora sp. AC03309]